MNNTQTFYLDQHGCAKNQVDGELIISQLLQAGWIRSEQAGDAQVIIVNSCGFIEAAKKESIDAVIEWKKHYPQAKILLAGCLAERYHAVLDENLLEADGFFGNGDITQIATVVKALFSEKRPILFSPQKQISAGERVELLSYPRSAYIKITEGCNNCCSYCAIPLIRGSLRSRSIHDIVAEIKSLLERGIFEFNLIGQDLAAYGGEAAFSDDFVLGQNKPLYYLLQKILQISGDFWIRLLYIHPDHFPFEILPLIAENNRILPYFDIPFQHADKTVLADMNRKGDFTKYTKLVSTIKSVLPNAILRTTFLVGFPRETEAAFQTCSDFLKGIQPDWSGCFTFSREEDTPAYFFKPTISKKIARERKKVLEDLQDNITEQKLQNHVGKIYMALVEEIVPPKDSTTTDNGYAFARCWFQAPEVDGITVIQYSLSNKKHQTAFFAGALIQVQILSSDGATLQAISV